ncbi:hypothetical protein EDC02_0122 [Micromonospora sp. Llam0]|nr:hypothetical protein EDC02_0122 [Micromonospora sp. Llam0]
MFLTVRRWLVSAVRDDVVEESVGVGLVVEQDARCAVSGYKLVYIGAYG